MVDYELEAIPAALSWRMGLVDAIERLLGADRAFRAWLGLMRPDAPVGLAGRLNDCPLVRYLRYALGYRRIRVDIGIVGSVYILVNREYFYPDAEWLTVFVNGLDRRYPSKPRCPHRVTAGEALAVLDEMAVPVREETEWTEDTLQAVGG